LLETESKPDFHQDWLGKIESEIESLLPLEIFIHTGKVHPTETQRPDAAFFLRRPLAALLE
jgi:hypothetical protein